MGWGDSRKCYSVLKLVGRGWEETGEQSKSVSQATDYGEWKVLSYHGG